MNEAGLKRIRRSPDVVWAELDGELVLLDLRTGSYYGLNRVGADIWRLLAQGCTAETILSHLVADYDIGADQVRWDLRTFIDGLVACGLAQYEEPDGG